MEIADILKAPHVGVREFRLNMAHVLKHRGPIILTDRGRPVRIILDYDEVIKSIGGAAKARVNISEVV